LTPAEFTPDIHTAPPGEAIADGPVQGALLPLVSINGTLYVVDNCLHFYPAAPSPRS
jgi:hypothetical protein